MDRYSNVVQNENGLAVKGASVLIRDNSGQVAILFADRAGATSLLNPLTTDQFGTFSFFAADGLYGAEITLGRTIKKTITDIRLEDLSDGIALYASNQGATNIGTTDSGNVQQKLDGLRQDVDAFEPYVLPAATNDVRGGVRIDASLTLNGDLLSLPIATNSVLGGVKAGSNVNIASDGTLTFTQYSLPTASGTTLGGIKVGVGLVVDTEGKLNATGLTIGSVASVNNIMPNAGNIELDTDDLPETGAPTNKWFTDARVRGAQLTGLSLSTGGAIAATDTTLGAFGKLQKQITDNVPAIVRSARTSNTMLVKADATKLIDITSGTFTQTFDTPANRGNGWYVWMRNSGTGDITIPASDGLTNWVMYPGEVRIFQCDGTADRSIVIQSFSRTFTTSGNFITPPGYQQIEGVLWAGGGSGAKNSNLSLLTSGGAGCGGAPFRLPASTLVVGASIPVTIGAGGAAQTIDANFGLPGGSSTFGAFVATYGGLGGSYSNNDSGLTSYGGTAYFAISSNQVFGAGVTVSNGDGYLNGGSGNIDGGMSVWGGAAGAGLNVNNLGVPGKSVLGGNGGVASVAGAASAGVAPGGGGGATRTGTSGAGARGELRIWGIV